MGVAAASFLGWDNIPEAIRALDTMARPDYVDLFTASTRELTDTSPEQWARAAFEGASPAGRFFAWQVVLRLRLHTRPSPDYVAGWKIADRGEHWIRLEASSWFLTAHCVFQIAERQLSFATFIRYDRSIAAVVWPTVSGIHRRAAPGLLHHAVKVARETAELCP